MKRFSILILMILLSGLSLNNPSLAQSSTLQDEISAYNRGDYSQTVSIGRYITSKNLNDATAHYYMANAYSRLDLIKDAVEEYSFCDKITDNPQLKAYCDQALHLLINNHPMPVNNFVNTGMNIQTNARFVPRNNQTVQEQIRSIDNWFQDAKKSIARDDPNRATIIENITQIRKQRIDEVRSAVNILPNQQIPNNSNSNEPYIETSPYISQHTNMPSLSSPTTPQPSTAPNPNSDTGQHPPSVPTNVATQPSAIPN